MIPTIMLKTNIVELSICVRSLFRIRAFEKPLSIKVCPIAIKMVSIPIIPKSAGDNIRAKII